MESLPITSTIILPIIEEAMLIEQDVGEFLIREKGLFMPGSEKPAVKEGVQYYQLVKTEKGEIGYLEQPAGSPIVATLVDKNGDIAVTRSQLGKLRDGPSMPLVGLKIIEAILTHELMSASEWDKPGWSLESVIEKYLNPDINWAREDALEFHSVADFPPAGKKGKLYLALDTYGLYRWEPGRYVLVPTNPGPMIQKHPIVERILTITSTIRHMLNQFVADDTWIIHLLRRRGNNVTVTKHIDWRIREYERLKSEGKIP